MRLQDDMKHILPACLFAVLSIAGAFSTDAAAAERKGITVMHMSNEQNIIDLCPEHRYLLLPVQDSAPEGRIQLVADNNVCGAGINIRLAREKVDYFVPLDLSAYRGRNLRLDVQAVPASSLCWSEISCSDTFSAELSPKPLYHHIPAHGWMNDPNGMFWKDGKYHLFYQSNPYGCTWGNMHWGHSVSEDLIHWEDAGPALAPDAWGYIFSGSAVVDKDNTAGFGENAVVAFYTSSKPTRWSDCQTQSIAYSTDGGRTFTKYGSNPVLVSDIQDFRDPKVFWYAPGKHWVMILAAGQQMRIYSSRDLKSWTYESSFGQTQGAHGGVWECPDLVELEVEGTGEKKWVLLCNINPGGPFGGSATQYFTGSFDGKKFVNEAPTLTKWMDWGKDNYATVTWSNVPDGRCIAIGWMSNWQYQVDLPQKGYRGTNTIARELSLYERDGVTCLKSAPVREMLSVRGDVLEKKPFRVSGMECAMDWCLPDGGAFEVEMKIRNNGAEKIGVVFGNKAGEQVKMYYDVSHGQFVADRTESGETGFNANFAAVTAAPAETDGEMTLRLFFDRTSVEIFGNGGEFVMTNLIFPTEPYTGLGFYSDRGSFTVTSLDIYPIVP